jgi:phosphoribosylanthranilate isomerase
MFQIKICGITSAADAQLAKQAGADAIGLNFYSQSRRYIDPQTASSIAIAISPDIAKIGLFVNASVEQIREVQEIVPLDMIQLHGDEPPEFLSQLAGTPILRAFRFGPDGILPIAEYLEQCDRLSCMPQAILIDAYAKGQFGGTGIQVDWQRLAEQRAKLPVDLPCILAGGLTAANVAEAIQVVQPHGVDVSSGVEQAADGDAPPRKDASQVQAFVSAASAALSESK